MVQVQVTLYSALSAVLSYDLYHMHNSKWLVHGIDGLPYKQQQQQQQQQQQNNNNNNHNKTSSGLKQI